MSAYWENGAYSHVEEQPAGSFVYLLRFGGWQIQRRDISEREALSINLHFLKSEAAFGPMSSQRKEHIELVGGSL